jgi:adhesin transport system outer membrane protein
VTPSAEARSLTESVKAALNQHPAIAASLQRRSSVSERVKIQHGDLLPTIDLRAETGIEYTDSPSTRGRFARGGPDDHFATLWRNSGSIVINQLIFDGLKTYNLLKSARAQLTKAGHQVVDTRQSIALKAIAAHVDVARQRDLVRIARRNVAAHSAILSGIRRQVSAGRATRADISQAQARLAQAIATREERIGDLRKAEVRYRSVVGLRPGQDISVPKIGTLLPQIRRLSLRRALRFARRHNPELHVARDEVRSRQYRFDATKGLFVPKVEFEFTAGMGNNLDGIRGRDSEVKAMVLMSWNLYRGGADLARRREALANLFTAKYDEADKFRVVRERVQQSYEALKAANSKLAPLADRISSAREVVAAYARQFDLGRRSLLDRLDVQNELFLSMAEHADQRYTAIFNYYSLIAASGGLLGYFDEPRDPESLKFGRQPLRAPITITGRRQTSEKEMEALSYRQVFERLLQEPRNVKLNLLYAKLAQQRGENRKALVAYQRVLSVDPDNKVARREVERIQYQLRTNRRYATLTAGVQFESNPRRFNVHSGRKWDAVFSGQLDYRDEHRIGDRMWRADVELFSNGHTHFDELNFGILKATYGPILPTYTGYTIRPFVNAAYSWFDLKTFFTEIGTGATLQTINNSDIFNSLTLKFDYDFVGSDFARRDAFRFEVSSKFIVPGNLFLPDSLSRDSLFAFSPYYKYNGVTTGTGGFDPRGERFPLRFHQLGGRLDYFLPLSSQFIANANFKAEYRYFNETISSGPSRRRDLLLVPGAQLIWRGLFRGQSDLVFSYSYERNYSTDDIREYGNHIVGVRFRWRL